MMKLLYFLFNRPEKAFLLKSFAQTKFGSASACLIIDFHLLQCNTMYNQSRLRNVCAVESHGNALRIASRIDSFYFYDLKRASCAENLSDFLFLVLGLHSSLVFAMLRCALPFGTESGH